jgi:hypothetical protein
VSVERTYFCDGLACERKISEAAAKGAPGSLLTIAGDGDDLHFCGWDCVLRHAGTKEPEQVLSGSPFPADDD